MHTYAKLNDGRLMIVYSDNTTEETMNLYPLELSQHFDPEVHTCQEFKYSEIAVTDTNLAAL